MNQAVECLKHSYNKKIVAFGNFILRKIFADPDLFQYKFNWEQIRWNAPLWWINHLKKQVDDSHLQNVLGVIIAASSFECALKQATIY